jgi:FtsZ-binding cell division protein ZapB
VLLALGAFAVCAATPPLQAQDGTYEQARQSYSDWVKLKQSTSQEQQEWAQEKASIEDSLRLAGEESAALKERVETLSSSASEADQKRTDLRGQIDAVKTEADAFRERVVAQEKRLRALLPFLPESLAAELRPLIQRLPDDPDSAKASVSQRLLTVVGLLSQIAKFNNALTIDTGISDLGGGEKVEVRTLYFGLGLAYFADNQGNHAGWGYPTAEGWKWEQAEGDTAANIRSAISMHQNMEPPRFVSLPVAIH